VSVALQAGNAWPARNLLTENWSSLYSDGMISEFLDLSRKVGQLAELATALRRENAELRQRCAALDEENADLVERIDEAHNRVAQLLDRLPGSKVQEAA
jgi:cell division protein ZapB